MENRPPSEPPGSPPKSPRPGGIRRYVRGGAIVFGGAFALGLGISALLPHVYESTALIGVKSGGGTANLPPDLEGSLLRLATNPTVLRALAHRLSTEDSPAALEAVRTMASVRELHDGGFRVTFRAGTAEAAQRGCSDMTTTIVAGVPELGGGSGASRGEELAQRTQKLALFVAAHPDLVAESPAAAASAQRGSAAHGSSAATDPALTLLRDEKKRLEAELAARTPAPAPAPSSVFGPNPYEDAPANPDTSKLQRRLIELRYAITAHQKALSDAPGGPPVVKPADDSELQAEWRRLVQSVVEAQQVAARTTAPPLTATVVEPPSLPGAPLSPRRWVVVTLSALAGLWAGLTFALLRSRGIGSRKRRRSSRPPAKAPMQGAAAITARAEELAKIDVSVGHPALRPQPTGIRSDDPAFAATVAMPIVTVDGTPGLEATVASAERPASDPARPRSSNPPPLPPNDPSRQNAAASPSGEAPRPRSDPPARATMKSEPPRPRSDPPARATMKSEPPRPRSDPPARATMKSEPPRPAMKSEPPRPAMKSEPPRPRSDPAPNVTQVSAAARGTGRPPKVTQSVSPPPAGPWPTKEEVSRPSQPPGPRRTLSPPPLEPLPGHRPSDEVPDTRRMGSDPSHLGQTAHHGTPRPDTKYSIVDPSRRGASRRPEPPPAERGLTARGTRPLATDMGVLRPGSDPPPGVTGYDGRPAPSLRGVTQRGWAVPSSPPPVGANGEVVRRESRPVPTGELVRPRSVPPSWRPPPPSASPLTEVNELRDQLLAQMTGKGFVLGVVSDAEAVDAKTALAARIALLLADAGARVLVLEANFDYPALGRFLGVEMPRMAGFSQQIHARSRTGEKVPWTVVRCTPNFHVLAEGFMHSPGVALSREFADAITELRSVYDFIIADGPIAGAGADSKPLNAYSDGLVVAVRRGRPLAEAIERASQWFSQKDLMAAVTFDAK